MFLNQRLKVQLLIFLDFCLVLIRVGKHTDELAQELVTSTEGKTSCKEWHTDGWGEYERALCSAQIEHYISKALTQRVERTNGTLR